MTMIAIVKWRKRRSQWNGSLRKNGRNDEKSCFHGRRNEPHSSNISTVSIDTQISVLITGVKYEHCWVNWRLESRRFIRPICVVHQRDSSWWPPAGASSESGSRFSSSRGRLETVPVD